MKIYLEYKNDKSQKFWEITIETNTFTTRYGKIGSEGQSKTKKFDTEEKAKKEAEKLIAQKKKKGYTGLESENTWVDFEPAEGLSANYEDLDFPILDEADILKIDKIKHYKGDFKINKDLEDYCVLIEGNASAKDLYIDENQILIITGNLSVNNVHICDGSLFIGGNLSVKQILLSDGDGHGVSSFIGETNVKLYMNFNGDIRSEVTSDFSFDEDNEEDVAFLMEALEIEEEDISWNEISYMNADDKAELIQFYEENHENFLSELDTESEPIEYTQEMLYLPNDIKIRDNWLVLNATDYAVMVNDNLYLTSRNSTDKIKVALPKGYKSSGMVLFNNQIFILGNHKRKLKVLIVENNKVINTTTFEEEDLYTSQYFIKTAQDLFLFIKGSIYQFQNDSWAIIHEYNPENIPEGLNNRQQNLWKFDEKRAYKSVYDCDGEFYLLGKKKGIRILDKFTTPLTYKEVTLPKIQEYEEFQSMEKYNGLYYFIADKKIISSDLNTFSTIQNLEEITNKPIIPQKCKLVNYKNNLYAYGLSWNLDIDYGAFHSIFKLNTNDTLEAVFTNCKFEPRSISNIQIKDDILWVFTKIAAYKFDGETWEMVEFETNYTEILPNELKEKIKNPNWDIQSFLFFTEGFAFSGDSKTRVDTYIKFAKENSPESIVNHFTNDDVPREFESATLNYLSNTYKVYGIQSEELDFLLSWTKQIAPLCTDAFTNIACFYALKKDFEMTANVLNEIMALKNKVDSDTLNELKNRITKDNNLFSMKNHEVFKKFKAFKF
ncbi:MAG: WGR domain-containing protein [Flavobacteriales bacterium]